MIKINKASVEMSGELAVLLTELQYAVKAIASSMKNSADASEEDVRDVLNEVLDMGIKRAFMSKEEQAQMLIDIIKKIVCGEEEEKADA